MSKLPTPTFITLPEAIEWLKERGISESDAKSHLPRAFTEKHLRPKGKCSGFSSTNEETNVHPDIWEEANIDWEDSCLTFPAWAGGGVWEYRFVNLPSAELANWFAQDKPDNRASDVGKKSLNPQTKDKGGAPVTYDWEAFYIEAARYVYNNGLPGTKAKMAKIMAEWCQNTWGNEPSETQMKKKIRPFFNAIRDDEGTN